jgi:hypothetical protein
MNDMDLKELTKQSYEKHGVKYSIYKEMNEFYGTPIPEGYEVILIEDGCFPKSLMLRKIQ